MEEFEMHDDSDLMDMSMEDFERALDESFVDERLAPGDKVTGTVVSIGKEYAFLDVGAKSEGIVALEELRDDDGELNVQIGDELEATVTTLRNGIHLSHKMRKADQSKELLRDAFENKIPVQGRVADTNRGGFDIDLGGENAFCPISQIDLAYVEDPSKYVNMTFHFLITRFDESGRNIVVSRQSLLRKEQEEAAKVTLARIEPGMLVKGTVKRLTEFGAFVDIGGVDGLVHVSQLSWDRVSSPTEVVALGDEITVKIMKIEEGGKRIGLSLREAGGNPWDDQVGSAITEGTTYAGTVMRIESYGAFVRLAPGVEGLLHVSEMSWGKGIKDPKDLVTIGEQIQVQVLSIDQDRKRISLGMKQLTDDPWLSVMESLTAGTIVEGTVAKIKPKGVEIALNDDVTAFLPASLSGVPRGEGLGKTYVQGASVKLQVADVRRDTRSIILAVSNQDAKEDQKAVEQYLKAQASAKPAASGLGSFGALLQRAIDKQD